MKSEEIIIDALSDCKSQIDLDGWVIPTYTSGSGANGLQLLHDTDVIDKYIKFAQTGSNEYVPECSKITYCPKEDFGKKEIEFLAKIMQLEHLIGIKEEDVQGFIESHEFFEGMPLIFFIAHIK